MWGDQRLDNSDALRRPNGRQSHEAILVICSATWTPWTQEQYPIAIPSGYVKIAIENGHL